MESGSRRRSLKVVRVLCDGCERASAVSYCTACNESACPVCAEQLHLRARRASKRSPTRTCNGRSMKDLQKAVGVLALCTECRSRPAYVSISFFFSPFLPISRENIMFTNHACLIFGWSLCLCFRNVGLSDMQMERCMLCVKNVAALIPLVRRRQRTRW